ncbi:MAG: DUF2934 domain-containing protein [Acidobacteriota bacterium]|nr:DUF2934 domain-containing protein [Acidobacteriota bacterium]
MKSTAVSRGGQEVTSNSVAEDLRAGETNQSRVSEDNTDQDIAKLAYALWQQRGCPGGSSEQDWVEAEGQLRQDSQVKTLTAAG